MDAGEHGSLECLVIIKCTKYVQLILRNIKIVTSRCQILRLNAPYRLSAGVPLQTLPGTYSAPSWILGAYFLGRGGEREKGRRVGVRDKKGR